METGEQRGHMSSGNILLLGAIAGLTIFCGLPVGRLRNPAPRLQAFLNASAIGILIFLLWDVLSNGWQHVEDALKAAQYSKGTWLHFSGLAAVFGVCLAVGLLGLVYYDRWMATRAEARKREIGTFGPGAASVREFSPGALAAAGIRLAPAQRLALFIALGIGLHNFAEGLAIGQSAAKNEVSLALMLIIGF